VGISVGLLVVIPTIVELHLTLCQLHQPRLVMGAVALLKLPPWNVQAMVVCQCSVYVNAVRALPRFSLVSISTY